MGICAYSISGYPLRSCHGVSTQHHTAAASPPGETDSSTRQPRVGGHMRSGTLWILAAATATPTASIPRRPCPYMPPVCVHAQAQLLTGIRRRPQPGWGHAGGFLDPFVDPGPTPLVTHHSSPNESRLRAGEAAHPGASRTLSLELIGAGDLSF